MAAGRRAVSGLSAGLIVMATVGVACGGADGDLAVPASNISAAGKVATSVVSPSTTMPPSTTVVASAESAASNDEPVGSTSTSLPPSTTLAGGPIPEAPDWFCAELAVESGELVLEVEAVLPVDGTIDPRSQHALLLATRNLLAWTNNRVPDELRPDVGLLNRVYADLGIELDRLDPGTVTMPRLQALVFAYVLESPVVAADELDLSARRLAAYVDRSCGHGYPIMEAMGDLFAPTGVESD